MEGNDRLLAFIFMLFGERGMVLEDWTVVNVIPVVERWRLGKPNITRPDNAILWGKAFNSHLEENDLVKQNQT